LAVAGTAARRRLAAPAGLPPDKGAAFVEGLTVGKFHGVGPATEAKMKRLGIHTGVQLDDVMAASEGIAPYVGHALPSRVLTASRQARIAPQR